MKSFIDGVAIHTIEYCLVAEMSNLFSPSSVLQMEEDLVSTIAAETQQNQTSREQTQRETEVLEKGLSICRMHMDRKTLSMLLPFPIRCKISNFEE